MDKTSRPDPDGTAYKQIQTLLDGFHQATGFGSALIDMADGKILATAGLPCSSCTNFPKCVVNCALGMQIQFCTSGFPFIEMPALYGGKGRLKLRMRGVQTTGAKPAISDSDASRMKISIAFLTSLVETVGDQAMARAELGESMAILRKQMAMRDEYEHRLSRQIEALKAGQGFRTRLLGKVDEAEKSLEKIEREDRIKSSILSWIGHELRTPVNALAGFATLIERSVKAIPNMAGHCRELRQGAEALLALADDILDLSKIESGSVHLHPVLEDFAAMLKGIPTAFWMDSSRKKMSVKIDIADGFPWAVTIDPPRIRQIMFSLTDCAAKLSGSDTITIKATATRVSKDPDGERGDLRVAVSDTSLINDAPDFARFFDMSIQLEPDASRKLHGVGLGLAISKRLASLMGGDIQARVLPQGGFEFVLQLKDILFADAPDMPAQEFPLEKNCPSMKLLLMDDDHACLNSIQSYLADFRWIQILFATDIEHARKTTASERPDILIFDAKSAKTDAMRLIREVKAILPELPIVAMTETTTGKNALKLAEACGQCLRKPVDQSELLACLNRLLPLPEAGENAGALESLAAVVMETAGPLVESAASAVLVSEVETMADSLAIIGLQHRNTILTDWTAELKSATTSLDIRNIRMALDKLQHVLESLVPGSKPSYGKTI